MLAEFIFKRIFRKEEESMVFLGTQQQKGAMFAVVNIKEIWKKKSLWEKAQSILRLSWNISDEELEKRGKEVFIRDIFGSSSDYGDRLFELMAWHNCQEWNLNKLTADDKAKADAMNGLSILTRIRYLSRSPSHHLNIFDHAPLMCVLAYPMVVKIPVLSMQFYLDIHSEFAFNAIRKSGHPKADQIIAYLYEILFLQQKTAVSLHELVKQIAYSEKQKKQALFINAEINAIVSTDNVLMYLKASIEKIISLVGLTFGIENLDGRKTHSAKVKILENIIPKELQKQYYYSFVLEYIKSENIDELTNYRTGLLHKKGISDLQPHKYVGEKAEKVPLKKIFHILQDQHAKNTAILIGALAILTDELVKLDPPNLSEEQMKFIFQEQRDALSKIVE